MMGAEFAAIRRSLGLSQPACAELMGYGQEGRKAICLWEGDRNARGIPGPARALIIAWRDGYRPKDARGRRIRFPNDKAKVK